MANEYEPWKELGQTEAEYFKARYIEARQEVARLEADRDRWKALYEKEHEAFMNAVAGEAEH